MTPDRKEKVLLALSAAWLVLSIPLSEQVYRETMDGGTLMRFFAFACVSVPVAALYGWRWIYGSPVPFKVSLPAAALGFLLALAWLQDRYIRDIAYIPALASVTFLALAIYHRGRGQKGTPTTAAVEAVFRKAPNKENMSEYLAECEPLVNEVHDKMAALRKFMRDNSLSAPIPVIDIMGDTALHAFGAVMCKYRLNKRPDERSPGVVAVFRTLMIDIYLRELRIMGRRLDDTEIKSPEMRKAATELIRSFADSARTAADDMRAGRQNPLFPLYQNLRPYLGAKATDDHVADMFDDLFRGFVCT